jgi:hypothetical protein
MRGTGMRSGASARSSHGAVAGRTHAYASRASPAPSLCLSLSHGRSYPACRAIDYRGHMSCYAQTRSMCAS